MIGLTAAVVVLCLGYSIQRAVAAWKVDPLHPVGLFHLFLILLLYSRLLVILLLDRDFRYVPAASPESLVVATLQLTLLALASSVVFEAAFVGGRNKSHAISPSAPATFSFGTGFVAYVVGAGALAAYYVLLAEGSSITGRIAESKDLAGGGALAVAGYLLWVGPVIMLAGRPEGPRHRTLFWLTMLFTFLAIILVGVYGRAGPVVWGILLLLTSYHYRVKPIRARSLLLLAIAAGVLLIGAKSFRLALSWGRDTEHVWDVLKIYGEMVLFSGGEQAITDMSLRLFMVGAEDFPVGSFWRRWITWPVDLLPSMLVEKVRSPTVGRHLYAWATGNSYVDSGVPAFGFVVAERTGTALFSLLVYSGLGRALGRIYRYTATSNLLWVVTYTALLWFVLVFSRIGDFSAAVTQVIVLAGAPLAFIVFLEIFLARPTPVEPNLGSSPRELHESQTRRAQNPSGHA